MHSFALYGLVLGLSLVAVGAMAVLLSNPSRMAVERPASPSPPRPALGPSPQVLAFAADLKSIPSLAELQATVLITCKGSGKQRQRPRQCTYHAGSLKVTIGYDRDDGTVRFVRFTKRSLDDTPPLPWSDVAKVMPWVCHEISAVEALATAAQAAKSYPATPWASADGMTLERPDEVGRRELHFPLHPHCEIGLEEQVDRGRDYSVQYIIRPKPARAA